MNVEKTGNEGKIGKYQRFWFEGSEYEYSKDHSKLEIILKYSLDKELFFTEKLVLPVEFAGKLGKDSGAFRRALRALEVVGGISYYKTYLPKETRGMEMSAEEAEFWGKVYQRGLGEFFYKNQIDFRGLVNFPSDGKENKPAYYVGEEEMEGKGSLVAIGGGKDSLVTAEILKAMGEDFALFSLRNAGPIKNTAEIVGKPHLVVERSIDARLFELNEQGALNGHVPITAYISCVMAVCAAWFGFKNIILSLEKSANIGQMVFHGMDINHQYSKSEEFEADFRNYLRKMVNSDLEFFSMLRGWNELRIGQVFASGENFGRYAPVFASCNANFKIVKEKSQTLWCGNCPKCLFVFMILAPFVAKEKMVEIFGQNLYEREDLLELAEEILGVRNFKPFECVGTAEESQLALWMVARKDEWKEDFLVKHFVEKVQPKLAVENWEAEVKKILAFSDVNFIPQKYRDFIKNL